MRAENSVQILNEILKATSVLKIAIKISWLKRERHTIEDIRPHHWSVFIHAVWIKCQTLDRDPDRSLAIMDDFLAIGKASLEKEKNADDAVQWHRLIDRSKELKLQIQNQKNEIN